MRYHHVIWDVDGTLIDTYPAMAGAFADALAELGYTEPVSEITARMKISMGVAMEYYGGLYPLDERFMSRYRALRMDAEALTAVAFDGAREVCRAVVENGGRNYILTHRGTTTRPLLERAGIVGLFSDMVTSVDGFARKPSPEGIEYLMGKWRFGAEDALMVGDRELDILAGKAAGVDTCYFSEVGGRCASADYEVKALPELLKILQERKR